MEFSGVVFQFILGRTFLWGYEQKRVLCREIVCFDLVISNKRARPHWSCAIDVLLIISFLSEGE